MHRQSSNKQGLDVGSCGTRAPVDEQVKKVVDEVRKGNAGQTRIAGVGNAKGFGNPTIGWQNVQE